MTEEQLKVAIIEDEKMVWKMLQMMLQSEGFEVVVATNSDEVTQLIETHGGSLFAAILDGNLTQDDKSGKDGKDAVKALRAANQNIVIIGHSGSGDIEVERVKIKNIGKSKTSSVEIVQILRTQREKQG